MKRRQIIWEMFAHLASGAVLVLYALNPGFRWLTVFLCLEYSIGIANTVFWLMWVSKVSDRTAGQRLTAKSMKMRAILLAFGLCSIVNN